MTLAAYTPVQYAGDGADVSFPVPFDFWDADDLKLILTVDATGVETTWVRGTQYTVAGGSGSTGTVTVLTSPTDYTPALGETLTIKSGLLDVQELSLPAGGALPSSPLEQQLDKTIRLLQQRSEELDRAVLLAETSTVSGVTIADPEAGKTLRWNTGGTALENVDISEGGELTLPLAVAEGGTAGITAAAARANLAAAGTGVANTFTAAQTFLASNPANNLLVGTCDGRLTLTSGLPVTTADVTAATTLYFTPYKGNRIALFDGTATWKIYAFSELSIAVPATTSTMYDLFMYDNAGTPTLELTAWANDTTRATALVLQNGVYVKTGATTRRYLGSCRTTGVSGQTEDSLVKRYVWSYYNRVLRPMRVTEATDTWTYTTATIRQANGAAANQLDFVLGVAEDIVKAKAQAAAINATGGINILVGIGLDSTSVFNSGGLFPNNTTTASSGIVGLFSSYEAYIAVGRHFLSWNEYSAAAGTTTWHGDSGDPAISQSGISGEIWG